MAEVLGGTRALPLEFSCDLHHIGVDEFILDCEVSMVENKMEELRWKSSRCKAG